MKRTVFLFIPLCVSVWLVGCNSSESPTTHVSPITAPVLSPLVGKWTGEAKLATGSDLTKIANKLSGDKMTGESHLTLNADGVGFLKVAKNAERPISWKQEGQKVILSPTVSSKTKDSDHGETTESTDSYVGTLSEDGKTMTLDMGDVKVVLTKSAS